MTIGCAMLALVTDAFGGRGGIAQYNRAFWARSGSVAVSSITAAMLSWYCARRLTPATLSIIDAGAQATILSIRRANVLRKIARDRLSMHIAERSFID